MFYVGCGYEQPDLVKGVPCQGDCNRLYLKGPFQSNPFYGLCTYLSLGSIGLS